MEVGGWKSLNDESCMHSPQYFVGILDWKSNVLEFPGDIYVFSLLHHFVMVCRDKIFCEEFPFDWEKNGRFMICELQSITCSYTLNNSFKLILNHAYKGFDNVRGITFTT